MLLPYKPFILPDPGYVSVEISHNGVDFSTQSLTFNSVNARGFGSNGNTRFVQLLDGVDGQAPGLNFPIGNILGASELDVESVELIPGAASALYGPNAMNGILLLNTKSPFDYQGLDIRTKVGTTHQDGIDHEASLYQDTGFRYAQAINNKFAFKEFHSRSSLPTVIFGHDDRKLHHDIFYLTRPDKEWIKFHLLTVRASVSNRITLKS
mgnify:CR=1 FL=1